MFSSNNERDFQIGVEVFLTYRGKVILDSRLAPVLRLVDEKGSLLTACRSLGLSYSRVWERIFKIESLLGLKLIEARRGGKGGGGAKLTIHAKRFLQTYSDAIEKVRPCAELLSVVPVVERPSPDLVLMGSHDPLLEHLIGIARSKGLGDIKVYWTGSLGGLASIVLGEADIAGVHLYDSKERIYNIPYIERFMLKNEVVLISGYRRELVFVLRPGLELDSLNEVFDGLANGELVVANRNKGAGTRVFLENLLSERDINPLSVKGFETEFRTHFDVIRMVATGKADVCLSLKYIAQIYKLKTLHVTWEDFDYVIPLGKFDKSEVKFFISLLKSSKDLILKYQGYLPTENTGEVKFK